MLIKRGFGAAIADSNHRSSSRPGQAILYADNLTDSMAKAIEETERRRAAGI